MSAIEFRIPVRDVASVYPGKSSEGGKDWRALTTRANELPFPATMQRAPDDVQVLTHDEARNVARIVAEGGHRLYPGEQALVPFMQAITQPIDASKIRDLPAGTPPVIPLPVRHQATSIATASITESDLKAFAKRLAETRPGNLDGNTTELRLSELSNEPSTMTSSELEYCRRIRNKYFPVSYTPKTATEGYTVPFFRSADGKVTAVLQREATMTFAESNTPYVRDMFTNKHIEVTVPRGAKLVVNYGGVSAVRSEPASSSEAGDVYKLGSGGGDVVCIKVVAQLDGNEPGVPQVLAVFGARMPGMSSATRDVPMS